MSSHDYASTWPNSGNEVGSPSGDAGAKAADREARLRSSLLRASAANVSFSAAALIGAAIYLGWLAHRLFDSRPETPHAPPSTWVTALLLALYGVAACMLSVWVRFTTRKLLRAHRSTERERQVAFQREQAKLIDEAAAARSAELAATQRQQLFMAKIGHEMRTPAQIIMADVEFLEHRLAETPELNPTLRRLGSAATLISHQMQGIAAYARSQSLRSDDRVESVMLRAAIYDIAKLHLASAEAKGLKLNVEAPEIELKVDLNKLRQIVENLLSNAVKYTSEGEVSIRAEVRATPEGLRELLIVVADTGVGIAQDVQERVFEPFFRAPSVSHRKDGLGLGLAIVKSLVDKLRGRVELRSGVGEGTTVSVAIPLVE